MLPSPARSSSRELGLSVGRPGPHAFTSAPGSFVGADNRAATRHVHRIPCSTFVTIAKRPSDERGTTRMMLLIWGRRQGIFWISEHGHCDRLARPAICAWRACANCPSGKKRFSNVREGAEKRARRSSSIARAKTDQALRKLRFGKSADDAIANHRRREALGFRCWMGGRGSRQ